VGDTAIKGDLAEGVLPGVLRTLYVERRTGLLHVTRGEERGSVCFIKGNIVYGDTTIKECHLGETLVRHGLLSPWDLERAGEMVGVTGRRLGQVLVDLGLLDAHGLEDALALHVREVLLTIFSWPDGAYAFEERTTAEFHGFDKPLPLSTGEVILDAVWSITDPDVVRYALGDLNRVLVPTSDPILRFQRIALNATDGFLLSRVDGTLTAAQILQLAPVSAEEAQRSLFGLLYTGMVEYFPEAPRSAPAPRSALRQQILDAFARLPGQRHHEALGVTSEASNKEIQAAFVRLAKLYHPDGHHEPELADLKDKLEALFTRVTEAHRTLSQAEAGEPREKPKAPKAPAPPATAAPSPPAPAVVEPAADPGNIDESLERGRQSLGAGRYWETLAIVDEVLRSATGRSRRRARVLKAEGLLKTDGGRRAAEEELKTALGEDAGNAEAHVLLGTIYKGGGAHALAAASFRRALDLQPRNAQALAELGSLGAGPEEKTNEKTRGLRRFFGG
jgi:tetratricopeptide (TPR) repeat protein